MHLLFTCADPQITTRNHRGYAIHIRELLDALARQQVAVTPFIAGDLTQHSTGTDSRLKAVLKNSFLKPMAYYWRDRVKWADSQKMAARVLQQISPPPDVIYERYEGTSQLGRRLAQKFQAPLVLEINAPFWQDARYYNHHRTHLAERLDRKTVSQAQAVIVVTQPLKNYLVEMGILAKKIRVISNGVNIETFANPGLLSGTEGFPQLKNKLVIGYVGSFSKWHRLDWLVEAAAQIPDAVIHFLLVGNGAEQPRIRHLVELRNLTHKFTFTGEIPYSQIPVYLQRFDIAVLPGTEAYCSPIKIFEYLAAGKPVVAPDLATLREIITPGDTGMLFHENDLADWVATLKFLINHPVRRDEIGKNGFNCVRTRFSWENTATEIIKVINEII